MKYIPTIGIECHVQLNSKTKLFAAVGNDAREAEPNSLISHICVGMPGALPVLNEGALALAAKAAFALGTKPQKFSHFDRKHYFYPDLPKGYQITQYANPIILGGQVELMVEGDKKIIRITRAHLEEDAGKNIHPAGSDYSLVDLNRAGTPLLEIVSEPDIHSAAEAKAFARELYLLMKYAGVSDVDLYHGNMRFDVNISISNQENKYGKRAEIKNLNSFRSVEAAVEYEIKRQTKLLESGQDVAQETRGWDEAKQKTVSQRGKEEAHDYRYFPDPDLPPIELSDEFVDALEKTVPLMPGVIRQKLSTANIDKKVIEDVLEREDIVPLALEILEKHGTEHARRAVFWLLGSSAKSTPSLSQIYELSQMVEQNKLNSTAAKEVFDNLVNSDDSAEAIAQRLNLIQISNEKELETIVKDIIDKNAAAADDIRNGEMKAVGFLVGQVMKQTAGKANPALVQQLIKKHLGV